MNIKININLHIKIAIRYLTKAKSFGIMYKSIDRGVAQLGRKIDRCLWQRKGDFSSGSDLVKTSEVTMRSLNLSRNRKRARI